MLMALNSLAAMQKNPTVETAKQITQFLSYRATHPDAMTEYRKSGMILRIYSNVSYISEPEARSRAGGFFSLGPKYNTLIQEMPLDNGPVNVKCSIMINIMESSTEVELGGFL